MRIFSFLKDAGITLKELQKALGRWNNRIYEVNSKLSQEEIGFLKKYFNKEINEYHLRIQKEEERFFDKILEDIKLELNFKFYDEEEEKFLLVVEEHNSLKLTVDNIKNKVKPFDNISRTEKRILLRTTLKSLQFIQEEIKIDREIKKYKKKDSPKNKTFTLGNENNNSNTNFPDGGNPFYNSLGDGEEAHTASWNID